MFKEIMMDMLNFPYMLLLSLYDNGTQRTELELSLFRSRMEEGFTTSFFGTMDNHYAFSLFTFAFCKSTFLTSPIQKGATHS